MKPTLDWYFDFVSPFSYFQSTRLERIEEHAAVSARPILFAAVLTHWGTLGPAELPTKRIWTFEHCAWIAHRHQIPLCLPAQHPFNPLPLLRLALAHGEGGVVPVALVVRLFRFVWVEGHLPSEAPAWAALLAELNTAPEAIETPPVKQALRDNGQRAIDAGVFGVPTAVIDGHNFWGFDATEMLEAYLQGDAFFSGDLLIAARQLPPGIERPRAPK